MLRCPYCHDGIGDEVTVDCPRCTAPHHAACTRIPPRCACCDAPLVVRRPLRWREPGRVARTLAWSALALPLLAAGDGLLEPSVMCTGHAEALVVRVEPAQRMTVCGRPKREPPAPTLDRLVAAHERALGVLRVRECEREQERCATCRLRALALGPRDVDERRELRAGVDFDFDDLHTCDRLCSSRAAWSWVAGHTYCECPARDPRWLRDELVIRADVHGEAHDRELASAVISRELGEPCDDEARLMREALACFPLDGPRALLALAALEAGVPGPSPDDRAVRRVLSTILDRQRPDGTWDRIAEAPRTAPELTATCVNALLLGHARARGWRAD